MAKPLALATRVLALLDLGVVELLDPAAVQAHQVVVVRALVEFVDRLAALEMAAGQDAGLLELRQHAVHGGQADVGALFQQHPEHVFGRHVPLRALLEHVQDLQARQRGLQAGALEFVDVGHGLPAPAPGRGSRYNRLIISLPVCPCPHLSSRASRLVLALAAVRGRERLRHFRQREPAHRRLDHALQGRGRAGQFRLPRAGRGAQARHEPPAGARHPGHAAGRPASSTPTAGTTSSPSSARACSRRRAS